MTRRTLLSRWLAVCTAILALTSWRGCSLRQTASPTSWPPLRLSPTDRLLILAPHPDDEILCCGGLLQEATARHLPVRIAFLTYGDNNQWSFLVYRRHPVVVPKAVQAMGLVRHDEAVAADRLVGIRPEQLTFLGYPDFGTLAIWRSHWGDRSPYQSLLTHVTAVPYANARRPGAPYKGEEVLRDLVSLLREFRPTKVFVSHPADHMPDHAALYLFTRVALWDLAAEMQPELDPYLVHFNRWPAPRSYRPFAPLEPPPMFKDEIAWRAYPLGPMAVERKHNAIQAHRTQYNSSARYLLSFIRLTELFGDFPNVTFRPEPSPIVAMGTPRQPFESPEELTDEETAAFVGVETRSVQLDGAELVLTIAFSRPLAEATAASVYIFGYRADRPFARMPKLHLKLSPIGQQLYDQDRELPAGGVQVSRQPKQVTVRLPLALLAQPTRILLSARTYLGEVPLDWVSWRILELPDAR